jgi:hypothetical protein
MEDDSMFLHRLIVVAAVVAVSLLPTPAAVAQSLPSGGVLVQGLNGLQVYTHTQNCTAEMRDSRFRCVLGYGQFAHLTFIYHHNTNDGCSFQVTNAGTEKTGDVFKIARLRDNFRRACTTNHKSHRLLDVLPTH